LQTLLQRLGGACKEQVRLIEKQCQQRLVGIAALGQLLEQLGQQPEQEGGVDLRRLMHQATGVEQVNAATAVRLRLQQVFQLQRRLTEQSGAALLLKGRQTPQQRLGRSLAEQCLIFAQQLRVGAEVVEQRLQVFQI